MSIIFGILKAGDRIVEEKQLRAFASATGRFALDGTFVKASGRVGMGFQPYFTNLTSNIEVQPLTDALGNMLAFDGRIDNHAELCGVLNVDKQSTADSVLVLAAFEKWGEESFSRLIGDWALALWSDAKQTLYLARDHAGTRTLYFEQMAGCIVWSTYLETFFVDRASCELDEGYATSYLAGRPTGDLTPYKEILAVTPSHYFVFNRGKITRKAHWQWMVKAEIRYKTDAEYEEHLFALFRQSVERRTGSGAPILAQLSGGMDSSSIVRMSDFIRTSEGASSRDFIDTLSFYDDSEPSWNERPYFTAVEALRGKEGIHVDVSSYRPTFISAGLPPETLPLLPGRDSGSWKQEKAFHALMEAKGCRVFLSGMGGDELLGGVPSAMPELADYLMARNLSALFQRAIPWCIHQQIPLTQMLREVVAFTMNAYRSGRPKFQHMPPWLSDSLRTQYLILGKDSNRFSASGGWLPSTISGEAAWWSLLETLPYLSPGIIARREYRYPYLDRDLVDFLLRLPHGQLVQPGRRRYLMRRAFKSILPVEVVERRRKAYIARAVSVSLEAGQDRIRDLVTESLLASCGYIDASVFKVKLSEAMQQGASEWRIPLMRTALFELWLRTSRTAAATTRVG
jgi:asparagine synthase (glutamine-hydrolysing)